MDANLLPCLKSDYYVTKEKRDLILYHKRHCPFSWMPWTQYNTSFIKEITYDQE